ncbi:hypothetical protein TYRP_022641, partial [Tyrophagus putrescentiae]
WKYGEAMAGLYNAPAAVVVTTTGGGGPNGSINPRRPILRRPAMNVGPTIAVVEVVGRPEGAPPTYEESVTVPPGGGFSYQHRPTHLNPNRSRFLILNRIPDPRPFPIYPYTDLSIEDDYPDYPDPNDNLPDPGGVLTAIVASFFGFILFIFLLFLCCCLLVTVKQRFFSTTPGMVLSSPTTVAANAPAAEPVVQFSQFSYPPVDFVVRQQQQQQQQQQSPPPPTYEAANYPRKKLVIT